MRHPGLTFLLLVCGLALASRLCADDHDEPIPRSPTLPLTAPRPLAPVDAPPLSSRPPTVSDEEDPPPRAPTHFPTPAVGLAKPLMDWLGMVGEKYKPWLLRPVAPIGRGLNPLPPSPLPEMRVTLPPVAKPPPALAAPGLVTGGALASDGGRDRNGAGGRPSPPYTAAEDGLPGYRARPIPPGFVPTPVTPNPITFRIPDDDAHGTPDVEPRRRRRDVRPPSGDGGPSRNYHDGEAIGRPPEARRARIPNVQFMIKDCGLPLLDQKDSARCLQFASTSILEHLANRDDSGRCLKHSERLDLPDWKMIESAQGSDSGFNEFTDQPFALARSPYAQGKGIPNFGRDVLFSCGYDESNQWNPWGTGGMTPEQIEDMKYALKTYNAPILFVYKPAEVKWWHANVCIGFNEEGFLCRDSAFGDDPYPNDPANRGKRDLYVLPYDLALRSGKHASVYYNKKERPPESKRVKQTRCRD